MKKKIQYNKKDMIQVKGKVHSRWAHHIAWLASGREWAHVSPSAQPSRLAFKAYPPISTQSLSFNESSLFFSSLHSIPPYIHTHSFILCSSTLYKHTYILFIHFYMHTLHWKRREKRRTHHFLLVCIIRIVALCVRLKVKKELKQLFPFSLI